jgi:hypothetical protein
MPARTRVFLDLLAEKFSAPRCQAAHLESETRKQQRIQAMRGTASAAAPEKQGA